MSGSVHPRFRVTVGQDMRAGVAHRRRRATSRIRDSTPSWAKAAQRTDGLITSMDKRKESPCQQDNHNDSLPSKIMRTRIPDLPEEIWSHIHSLLPMRDAGRAACLSHAFLRSWICHPNLVFDKDTIGVKKNSYGENFHHKISRILRNHSGISLKTFKLDYSGICGFDGTSYLDSWLQAVLISGIEEVTLWLSDTRRKYEFPCSLLSNGVRNSLRYLKLRFCALHPTVELGPLRSLTSLHLFFVTITWDELKCLLSNSLALEELELVLCEEIVCLKIPCALQRLNSLHITGCSNLEVIESKAPNLSSLKLIGHGLNFSRVETLQIKKLIIERTIHDAHNRLPSITPNLETLVIYSDLNYQAVAAPILPTKFLCLKHLAIRLSSGTTITQAFDYFSLVSFLDASPFLENFILNVSQGRMIHESISAHPQLRHTPEHRHGHLKSMKICGFNSAKSLFELTCYILENAVSLECLTLDTFYGARCGQGKCTSCSPVPDNIFMDASKAILAIRTYIEHKVPSTVKLTVLETCSRCHVRGVY